jgi:Zn-dependent protease with chaperone function
MMIRGVLTRSCHRRVLLSTQRWTFSSSSSSSSSSSFFGWNWNNAYNKKFSWIRWKTMARWIRYTRIPIVILSVYSLGYQQGIADHVRNPEETQRALLQQVYASVGVVSSSSSDRQVYTIRDHDDNDNDHDNDNDDDKNKNYNPLRKFSFSSTTTQTTTTTTTSSSSSNRKTPSQNWSYSSCQRIARIGKKIIQVARIYVQEQMQQIATELRTHVLPPDATEDQVLSALLEHPEFSTWYKAYVHLRGHWTYVLLETPIPNAFVTEVIPKHIFVTIAMLELMENEDELALILAHEVSHLLLGHVSQQNWLEAILRTIEVLLLSLDPTEGLVSIVIIGGLATIRTALQASFSREHEREADTLGMRLAARACFDTQRAPQVFARLHQREEEAAAAAAAGGGLNPFQINNSVVVSFASTHPSSHERYQYLMEQSEKEHPQAYDACQTIQKHLHKAGILTRPWW